MCCCYCCEYFFSPSSEGIGCIRHSRSIVACTVGNSEIFVFQLDGGNTRSFMNSPFARRVGCQDGSYFSFLVIGRLLTV